MPKVMIITGYPGAGKTSTAKYIAKKYNFAYLEYDTFLWHINSSTKHLKLDYLITYKNILCVLKNYLKTSKNIIIEGALVPRTKDDPFEVKKIISIIKKSKHDLKIVQLVASNKVCLERMKIRDHVVPKWERNLFKKNLDKLVLENKIIIDTTTLSLRQVVNKILK